MNDERYGGRSGDRESGSLTVEVLTGGRRPRLRLSSKVPKTMMIRKSRQSDFDALLAIVNEAAQAYRGVIPADRWREPYMPPEELKQEIANGVIFWVVEEDGRLVAVMGIQDKEEVALVRHAYVTPTMQRKGVGTRLLRHVEGLTERPTLIGTWADASWAIAFYQRNGYSVVPNEYKDPFLRKYWSIPARQVETSVVLAHAQWIEAQQRAPADS